MSWARAPIEALRRGETVTFRPRGHSMRGRVASGQRVVVAPVDAQTRLQVGDVVLCRVHGRDYLHLVKAREGDGDVARYLIGNNRGGTNGWVHGHAIFGRMLSVAAPRDG